MRVLVTGSSGYLASLVLPRLAADPAVSRLAGIDLRPPTAAPSELVHIQASVNDPELGAIVARERPDLILHLAWVFNPSHDREAMRRVDVDGTANVLQAAARASVPHLIYLSSTTGYGAHPDNPPLLDESSRLRGNEDFPYAADKAAVERLLDGFERDHPAIGVTRLRPCIVLGRRTDNFVRALIAMPAFLRVSGHDPPLQFLHEGDLADALALLVKRRPRGAYNLAPEPTVRMSEIGALLARPALALPEAWLRPLIGIAWRLRLIGVPPSYLEFVKWPWVADASKIREELGFVARRSSREALLATRPAAASG